MLEGLKQRLKIMMLQGATSLTTIRLKATLLWLESRILLVAIMTVAMTTPAMSWNPLTKMGLVKIWTSLISFNSQ